MNSCRKGTDREDLRFFGRVSASVSHDIKNVLAVINEGAGLLEDLSLMAEKGMPLEPQKLKSVAGNIIGQIRRGDEIVKNMNAFAHSVDSDVVDVDLVNMLGLLTALAKRLASMKCVTLEIGECEAAMVRTDPYSLERLVHGCIACALESMESGGILTLSVKPESSGAVLSMSGMGPGKTVEPDSSAKGLARSLGAEINIDNAGGLELNLPAVLPEINENQQ